MGGPINLLLPRGGGGGSPRPESCAREVDMGKLKLNLKPEYLRFVAKGNTTVPRRGG